MNAAERFPFAILDLPLADAVALPGMHAEIEEISGFGLREQERIGGSAPPQRARHRDRPPDRIR